MNWGQLKATTDKFAPIIIHLDKGIGHFAVLLGITEDTAILADPAQGTLFMNKNTFCNSWSGNVLLAISKNHNLQKNKLVKATKSTLLCKEALEKTVVTIKRLPRRKHNFIFFLHY